MKGLATVSPLVKGCGERMGLFSHHYKERENIFETSVQILFTVCSEPNANTKYKQK